MKTKWLKLAGQFLRIASNELSNHGCNDWDFPDDWTKEEKQEFVQAMHLDNKSPEEYDPENLNVPDWWVAAFLSNSIKKMEFKNEKQNDND